MIEEETNKWKLLHGGCGGGFNLTRRTKRKKHIFKDSNIKLTFNKKGANGQREDE